MVCRSQNQKNPTYPWNIPPTQNQQFMTEFLSFGGLGCLGYALRVCWGSLRKMASPFRHGPFGVPTSGP